MDGTLHLNAAVWDEKLMKNNYHEDVIRVLLKITGQGDESGKVAKFYADLLKSTKTSSSTKEGAATVAQSKLVKG